MHGWHSGDGRRSYFGAATRTAAPTANWEDEKCKSQPVVLLNVVGGVKKTRITLVKRFGIGGAHRDDSPIGVGNKADGQKAGQLVFGADPGHRHGRQGAD